MTKLSKYHMNKNVEQRMFEVFWDTIASIHTRDNVQQFFRELLTPTEQTMLAKRFAIALLLTKNYSYKEIVNVLKVSETTVSSVSRWLKYEGKMFPITIKRLLEQEQQQEFWDNLEEFFTFLLPPRHGSNWSRVRKEQYKEFKQRRRKRALL